MNFKKSRKVKYGASSVAFTVAVVAAVIIFNTVFKAVADAALWYIDMTKEQVFTLSDATQELLSDVTSPVNIYFTQDADELMSGEGSSSYMKYVYQTALQLEKNFSNIKVTCVDVIENPAFFEYYYNTAASTIKTTNVIVESGSEFRLLSVDAFFLWDEDRTYIWAYDGEAKFTSSILQVTAAEMPVVYFTTGHGEPAREDSEALWSLFETAGYEVRAIDLSKETPEDTGRILVINNPIYDFAGIEAGEGKNEIDKVDDFVDRLGCLMVFADSENSKNLTNLSEFMYEWGISFESGKTVIDREDSVTNDGKAIVAKYEEENTLGASLYREINQLASKPKVIFENAMPLSLVYEEDDSLTASRISSPVFYSGDSAEIYENGEKVSSGNYPIAAIARESIVKDNDYFYNYVFACGSPAFTADKYINSSSYANSDIILNTARLIGREKVVADIDPKVLDETELDITTAQANNWSVAMIVTLPVIVAIAGITVCIRRRRK